MKLFQSFLSMILYGNTSGNAAMLSSRNSQLKSLPKCAFRSSEPCQCPENTIFQNSTTKVTIGANAKHVAAILYSFFEVPWIGVDPISTSGKDLAVGSTRTMPLEGLYFVEEVLESWKTSNGSFELVVSQRDIPIMLEGMNGTYYFSGYWDDSKISYINKSQTKLVWHAHGCITLPAGFDTFQRSAINNTFRYLEERGQLVGYSTLPQTVVFPPEFAGSLIIQSWVL